MTKPTIIEHPNGVKEWCLNGLTHRKDGPAIEYDNGSKEWYFNGKLHREDGPAFEYADGSKEWYFNGKCHREDGPALEYSNGTKMWWLNDVEVPKCPQCELPMERCSTHNATVDLVISKIVELVDNQMPIAATDYLTNWLDNLLHSRNLETIKSVMEQIELQKMPTSLLTALLMVTASEREALGESRILALNKIHSILVDREGEDLANKTIKRLQ